VKESEEFLKQHGPFDMIFIDHVKGEYLADFLLLEQYGVIAKGSLIIGDNIIKPGAPDYLAHFNSSFTYESTLYHSYVEYCDVPDAVLVSKKL
jgi:catechol O-methyltransferase